MRFRLTATSVPYNHPDGELTFLSKYLEKIKNADPELDLPDPIIEDGCVYIHLMYGSQFFNLARLLDEELVVRNEKEPIVEIYDYWRE